jgi:hypothetical protein
MFNNSVICFLRIWNAHFFIVFDKKHEMNQLGASIEHQSSKLALRSKLIAGYLGKYLHKICLFSEPATNFFKEI